MAPLRPATRIKVSHARCTQKKKPTERDDPTPSHPSTHSTGAQPTECNTALAYAAAASPSARRGCALHRAGSTRSLVQARRGTRGGSDDFTSVRYLETFRERVIGFSGRECIRRKLAGDIDVRNRRLHVCISCTYLLKIGT